MTRAVWNGITLAASDAIVHVEGNAYFPSVEVDWTHLRPSAETPETFCHWKGFASYFDVIGDGAESLGAAWHYREPYAQAARIAGHVAFWKDVEIVGAPAGPGFVEPSPSRRGALSGWEALCWLLRHPVAPTLTAADIREHTGLAETDVAAAWQVHDVQRYARRYRWTLTGGTGGEPVRLDQAPGEPVSG